MMYYQLFHNQDARFSRAAIVGDEFVAGWTGTVPDGLSEDSALEWVWAEHNREDRPDGLFRPSLSVGDVVVLSTPQFGEAPFVRAFTVDRVGWLVVPTPKNVLAVPPGLEVEV